MPTSQYTIRNIPAQVDQVIRKEAKRSGKSVNQTVVDLLALQTLGTINPKEEKGFDWLYNQNTLDPCFDDALAELSQIDAALWS